MAKPAYETLDDLNPGTAFRVRSVAQVFAGREPPTVRDLKDSIDRTGPDDAILEVALLLPEDEYQTVKRHWNEARRVSTWPHHGKTRRRT